MKKSIVYLAVIACILSFDVLGQSVGDTVKVQSFVYSSGTRDTVISFPNNPNVSYERVIMRYAMRCKNALVSTGSARNLGCGEWDYSCNTYVHNPLLADSISRSVFKYTVAPNNTNDSVFSLIPTFKRIPGLQTSVVLNGITNEDTAKIGSNFNNDSTTINSRAATGKTLLSYTAAELIAAGAIAGDLDAMSLHAVSTQSIPIKGLKIKIKQTTGSPLAAIDGSTTSNMQEVYFHDYTFQQGENRFQFHSPFNWDGTSDILVELSYRGNPNNPYLYISTYNKSGTSVFSKNDYALNLFTGNYTEADNYTGISGANQRTVEAWIKTSSGGEITTWGTNSANQKQSFWVNGSGKLRLEVNSGYTIGTAAVNDGNWHHVAYTFNGTNLNDVKFYIDGVWDWPSQTQVRPMATGSSTKLQVSKGFHNRYFDGQIDDVRIWSTALSQSTIDTWRFLKIDALSPHPNLASLDVNYPIQNESAQIMDISGNNQHSTFTQPSFYLEPAESAFKSFESSFQTASPSFYQGVYNLTIGTDTIMDTVYNQPYAITERTIIPRSGTTLTDSIALANYSYYSKNNETYDLNGTLVSTNLSPQVVTLSQSVLDYYQRNPSKVEIMSFVTPYGINLDLGQRGKAWYFDLTDYLPVLQGNRRITMERGGQWQEEMDIQFLFIVGTPPAEVKKVQQIWRVDSRNYTDINNDRYFAPRDVSLDTSASRFKVRSAITGHGQQGEFIARNHTITVNNGAMTYNNLVWLECAENPVYPQGGTWIYDRAGWCPGMPTTVKEYDITSFVNGNSVNLEYNVGVASGDSRYIVNNQLVSYGSPNFSQDARLIKVRRPTNETELGRLNPSCYNPIVTIQNTGSSPMASADIEYWIDNGPRFTHTWTGSLNFMEQGNALISTSPSLWNVAPGVNHIFHARITSVNGGADQYPTNDSIRSTFRLPDELPDGYILVLKTNSRGFENSVQIRDETGATVFTKTGLSNNTTYVDTISFGPGCYQLRLFDSNDDGLSFFANSAGSGFFRILDPNTLQVIQNFNPDFGDRVEYFYTVDMTSSLTEEESKNAIHVYPNPVQEKLTILLKNGGDWTLSNALGQVVNSGAFDSGKHSHNLDVSKEKPGIYYLQIKNSDQQFSQKIIIQ